MKKQPINSIWSYMLLMGSVMMFTSTITYGEQKIVSFEELSDNHELAVPSYTAVCDETNIVKAEPGDVLKYLMEQGPIQKSFSSIPDSNLDRRY